jgi:hypothetical protein
VQEAGSWQSADTALARVSTAQHAQQLHLELTRGVRSACWCLPGRALLTAQLPAVCVSVCRLLQETERKLADLRARRKDHVRAVLMQQNFLLGACLCVCVGVL